MLIVLWEYEEDLNKVIQIKYQAIYNWSTIAVYKVKKVDSIIILEKYKYRNNYKEKMKNLSKWL